MQPQTTSSPEKPEQQAETEIQVDLNSLTRVPGGTYTPLFIAEAKVGEEGTFKVVIKQYGKNPEKAEEKADCLTANEADVVLEDCSTLKASLQRTGLKTPRTYCWSLVSPSLSYTEVLSSINDRQQAAKITDPEEKFRLLVIEEYAGISIRQLIREVIRTNQPSDLEILKDLITKVRDMITRVPEDAPLDINPANFTMSPEGDIYFVDFMPPYPDRYRANPRMREIFPTISNKEDYSDYYLTDKRLARFDQYLTRMRSKL